MAIERRRAWVVAGFAAALLLALVVCAFGFVSLLTDAEVVADPEAGRLVGPAIVAASVGAVLVFLGLRLPREHGLVAMTLQGVLLAWSAGVVAGTIAYGLATGTVLAALLFALSFMTLGFGVLVPALTALVVPLAAVTARAEAGGAERPRWPWERDDEQ
jgi:hypothetical protein